jgi:hypothetical protein
MLWYYGKHAQLILSGDFSTTYLGVGIHESLALKNLGWQSSLHRPYFQTQHWIQMWTSVSQTRIFSLVGTDEILHGSATLTPTSSFTFTFIPWTQDPSVNSLSPPTLLSTNKINLILEFLRPIGPLNKENWPLITYEPIDRSSRLQGEYQSF